MKTIKAVMIFLTISLFGCEIVGPSVKVSGPKVKVDDSTIKVKGGSHRHCPPGQAKKGIVER